MLRKSILLAALVGSVAIAAPKKSDSQPSSMAVDKSWPVDDPVTARDHQRELEARWFIVGADDQSIYLVDRKTVERKGTVRTGWTMAIQFGSGKVLMRAAIRQNWDCSKRTATVLSMQTYDGVGTPDPRRTVVPRAEPVVPDTVGEDAFDFVCARPARGDTFPLPVSRDHISAAQILAAYADGAEVTVLGLLLATLDPWKDEERLKRLVKLALAEKRAKLTQLIWGGLR